MFVNSLYFRKREVDSLTYTNYFGFSVVNQNRKWVPHMFCDRCRIVLVQWSSGENDYLSFASRMLWREPNIHENDIYYCVTKTLGYNKIIKASIIYANVLSVTKLLYIRKIYHIEFVRAMQVQVY